LVADFDTGSRHTFADADLLQRQGVIHLLPTTLWAVGWHLNRSFRYTPKSLIVILTAADGTQKTSSQTILCVRNWQQSPFVAVNPNRTALIGRSLCLATQVKITSGLRPTSHFGARLKGSGISVVADSGRRGVALTLMGDGWAKARAQRGR
jgi:hypothetical protein